jgi:beta-phosphoglucomutase
MIAQLSQTLHAPPTLEELMNHLPQLKALAFDMDGTLFDTEKLHIKIFYKLALKYGITLPPDLRELAEKYKGWSDEQVYAALAPQKAPSAQDFILEKNTVLLKLIETSDPSEWTSPHLFSLLKEAQAQGIKLVLVTSSEKLITHALLKKSGYDQFFSFVVTLQDVTKAKPHPEPYLAAQKLLNCSTQELLVFEDSPTGLESARTSGLETFEVKWW